MKITILTADIQDAASILNLQKRAFASEAELYADFSIPPLRQTLESMCGDLKNYLVLKAVCGNTLVGSVRACMQPEEVCYIGRLMVHPDWQNQGIGKQLMMAIEASFPQAGCFHLGTGHKSLKNIEFYLRLGYSKTTEEKVSDKLIMVHMEKINTRIQESPRSDK